MGLNLPVYISDRSQPDKKLGGFHDRLRHWLYPKATGLILQTQKAKEIFLQKSRHSNIAVIGNPIKPISSEATESKEKKVLMVGRLIKTKQQDKLIEMFAKVSPQDWRLELVGYDHMKQQHLDPLKELSKRLGVYDRVDFLGKQDQLEDIYLGASIFAFTSSSEGFPNVIGEAMSAGLPVIAFDCVAGPSDMITDGQDGFLVPLNDTDVFESRLETLLRDEELRLELGAKARESIKRFSAEEVAHTFLQFITSHLVKMEENK
jgi:GalNAc-alpha-(1->4)-GalNAc-alpha-(1->3)-diNAcBac-PP-undecaprenol alpha-1,4-N-acetyl-D-galactosaminyltransferase